LAAVERRPLILPIRHRQDDPITEGDPVHELDRRRGGRRPERATKGPVYVMKLTAGEQILLVLPTRYDRPAPRRTR
jgi:hypothetical protein